MPENKKFQNVLVTGGAGYVGAVLVPKLLEQNYHVRVLDLFLFGHDVFNGASGHTRLELIKGDIRNREIVQRSLKGCDAVIHLACISNDPSCDLNPALTRSINYDAFIPFARACKDNKIRRFIFASSSSVYGISGAKNVTEEHPLVPITDYNRYKALCEHVLLEEQTDDFIPVIIRPATICGYSTRQRLDLTVNILTNHAVNNGCITVFGGGQMRPNLHIDDMIDLYTTLLELPDEKIRGKIYNAGYENHTVDELAEFVKAVIQKEMPEQNHIRIQRTPSDDIRSYHISSEKIKGELGFSPKRTIEDAVRDLIRAFRENKIPEPMTNKRYYNIKTMQEIHLQ